jgi:hypothetical protein
MFRGQKRKRNGDSEEKRHERRRQIYTREKNEN